jgi:hypothetical protein
MVSEPEPVALRPREHRARTWLGAPLRPDAFGVRFADLIYLDLGWNDTAGHPGRYYRSDGSSSQAMRLYRNGRLLADWSDQDGSVVVPEARARYRLERDVDARGSFALATSDRTRWWFRSAAPVEDFSPLPLLDLDYTLAGLGARNRLARGRPASSPPVAVSVSGPRAVTPEPAPAARPWSGHSPSESSGATNRGSNTSQLAPEWRVLGVTRPVW